MVLARIGAHRTAQALPWRSKVSHISTCSPRSQTPTPKPRPTLGATGSSCALQALLPPSSPLALSVIKESTCQDRSSAPIFCQLLEDIVPFHVLFGRHRQNQVPCLGISSWVLWVNGEIPLRLLFSSSASPKRPLKMYQSHKVSAFALHKFNFRVSHYFRDVK